MSSFGSNCSSNLNGFLFNSMNSVGVRTYGAVKMFFCVWSLKMAWKVVLESKKRWWEMCMIMKCKCASSFSTSTLFWPLQTLRKKGFNGCNSPEPDGDDSIDQSPLNDRKTEDLDSLFKRYGVSTVTPLSPFLTYSFCSPSLSLSAISSVSIFLSLSLWPLLLLYGEQRLWTRKSTGTLRAQTPRSHSPSPPALRRNTKKLTRSLIKWCRTIGCQWVPPTILCNPAPPPHVAAAADRK